MKFQYTYFTADRVRHIGVVSAKSREDVYVSLKDRGIRPVKVEIAPGVLNRIVGLGKRWFAIAVLGLLLCGAVLALLRSNGNRAGGLVDAMDRHQIYGDGAIIEAGVQSAWQTVFDSLGDRFLSSFAQPGVPSTFDRLTEEIEQDLVSCLDSQVPTKSDDLIEHRQVRRIVSGMKQELKSYLADGGTVRLYAMRLFERQRLEKAIYDRYAKELQSELDEQGWVRRNRELREIGIRTIPMPISLMKRRENPYAKKK